MVVKGMIPAFRSKEVGLVGVLIMGAIAVFDLA